MSQGFEDQVRSDVTLNPPTVEVPAEEAKVVESNPLVVEHIATPPDLESLCKGHGKIEVVSGEKRLLGHKGYIFVSSVESVMVVSNTPNSALELRDKIQDVSGVVPVDDTHTLVPIAAFNKVKRLIRMKRNISEDSRERKRQRMRDFWSKKKSSSPTVPTSSVSEIEPQISSERPEPPQVG